MRTSHPLAIYQPSGYEEKSLKAHNTRVGKTEIRETFGPVWRFPVENYSVSGVTMHSNKRCFIDLRVSAGIASPVDKPPEPNGQ